MFFRGSFMRNCAAKLRHNSLCCYLYVSVSFIGSNRQIRDVFFSSYQVILAAYSEEILLLFVTQFKSGVLSMVALAMRTRRLGLFKVLRKSSMGNVRPG